MFTSENITLSLLQLKPCKSIEENLEKGLSACRKAKMYGADIILFPEMWNCGYSLPQDKDMLFRLAVEKDGMFVTAFSHIASELDTAVAITYLEKTDGLPKNSVTVFDRHGNRILDYSKVHTCDFGEEKVLSAGDGFYTAELDTAKGKIKIGAMICYDREFPESARILMLEGAELVLVPNACPMEINRLSQLRARAYENMMCIATCNYPHTVPDCNGHSTVFDGMAYRPEECGARDTLILEAGENEGIYTADIPIDEIREYRMREVHGNAYRHPSKYHALTEEKIEAPFIRGDYRK